MNIVLDLDLTLRGPIVSPILYIIMCPWLYAYLDACVCVCGRGEDAGIRGIVQYVTFSKTYHFSGVKLIA